MSQPFLGQLQAFSFGYAPRQWAQCNGQLLSIQQNTALFALLGTYYGGNGVSTFQLPNLQSRVPMSYGTFAGNTYDIGEIGGVENVTLSTNNIPVHNHAFVGSSGNATAAVPITGTVLATTQKAGGGAGDPFYGPDGSPFAINPTTIGPNNGNLPHTNIQPYLAINWCIALFGIFPSRS